MDTHIRREENDELAIARSQGYLSLRCGRCRQYRLTMHDPRTKDEDGCIVCEKCGAQYAVVLKEIPCSA